MNFLKMFEDQRTFNQLVWDKRGFRQNPAAVIDRIHHLCTGMFEETIEFLRTFEYKSHRRSKVRLQNVAHSHEELIDMFKYWMSIADVADFPMDRLEELYYAKSRVVQYRYQEEWLKEVKGPSVVVDIDMVLGDYVTAMCEWAKTYGPKLMELRPPDQMRFSLRLQEIQRAQSFINSDAVGMERMQWQKVKHDFRTRGGKLTLPVYADAKPFLQWCRSKGWTIILITSRPITEYPNIFTDTITWLTEKGLPFDHLWWTEKKDERLEEAHIQLRSQIVFAVDDSFVYVDQFANKGVRTYWLVRGDDRRDPHDRDMAHPNIRCVRSLTEIMEQEKETTDVLRRRQTPAPRSAHGRETGQQDY